MMGWVYQQAVHRAPRTKGGVGQPQPRGFCKQPRVRVALWLMDGTALGQAGASVQEQAGLLFHAVSHWWLVGAVSLSAASAFGDQQVWTGLLTRPWSRRA